MRSTAGILLFSIAAFGADPSIHAEFRSGQTFITWRQEPDAVARYRIYRSTTPLRAASDLTPARLIAEVNDHTSLNLMASIDRLKLSNTRAPAEFEILNRVYFVIKEGEPPLSLDTGLFVYTVRADETAYYAVTTGGQDFAATTGVAERVEYPNPVRQNELDYVHWTDNAGTKYYPAMSSVPGTPYNFRLRLPAGKGPSPLIGFLHGGYLQYSNASMGGEPESSAVRIAFDSPVMRGKIKGIPEEAYPMGAWYGYNENFGTGKPLADGKVIDYVVRRILWTLEWAERTFATDPDRVSLRGGSMGGSGVITIGLLHSERFAAIHAFIPPLRMARSSGEASAMLPIVPADYIAGHPDKELPYIMYTAGRTDNIVGWPDKVEFAAAMEKQKLAFTFYWDLRGHDQNYKGPVPESVKEPPVPWGRTPQRPEMPVVSFSRKQSFPALSKVTLDSDPGTVNFGVRPTERPPLDSPGAGDLIGTIHGTINWDRESIVDTEQRYEIGLRLMPFAGGDSGTASVTPRRLQRFRPAAGKTYHYEVTDVATRRILASGEVRTDAKGLVTIDAVPISKTGSKLAIW